LGYNAADPRESDTVLTSIAAFRISIESPASFEAGNRVKHRVLCHLLN
jgi:hypothetical protein